MAYITGTADDYLDLLDTLLDFLTGEEGNLPSEEQWTVKDDNTLDNGNDREVFLEGPGGEGMDPFHVGIRTYSDKAKEINNWYLAGSTEYDPDLSWDSISDSHVIAATPFWKHEIPYWIVANGRRLIIVAKVANTYQSIHLGYILAYGSPGDHPYPLYVAGTLPENHKDSRFNDIPTPGDVTYGYYPNSVFCPSYDQDDDPSSGYFYTHEEEWLKGGSKDADTLNDSKNFVFFPFQAIAKNEGTISWLRTGPDDKRTLLPFVLYSPGNWMAGEIQGLYAAYGDNGAKPEDVVEIDGTDYLLFPDVSDAGISKYGALRLE